MWHYVWPSHMSQRVMKEWNISQLYNTENMIEDSRISNVI